MNKLALVAATLILPVLAFGKSKGDDNDHGKGGGGGNSHIPVVPETNPGWVLVPFFGAVLLFSARKHLRGMVTE
jgi:hypothetical protein